MKKKTSADSTNQSLEQDKAEKEEALQVIEELEIAQSRIIQSLNERILNLREEIEALKQSSNPTLKHESPVSPTRILSRKSHQSSTSKISSKRTGIEAYKKKESDSVYEKREIPNKNSHNNKWIHLLFLISIIAFLASTASYTVGFLTTKDVSSTVESNIAFSQDLGVYTDSRCTQNLTGIDWGTLLPGEKISHMLYVRNLGNTSFTLQLQAVDWSPSLLSDDVVLTWDYRGQVMEPTDIVPIVLSLSVSPDIENVNTFTHNIVLTTHPLESS